MVTPQMFVKLVSSGAQLQAQIVGSDDSSAWSLGDDGDVVFFLRSDALGINTGLDGVLVGTPVTPAIAANSAIISNITEDGDILFAVRDGDNSKGLLKLDGANGNVIVHGGSLGLGVTPATNWHSNETIFQIGSTQNTLMATGTDVLALTQNAYVNTSSAFIRVNESAGASNFYQNGGSHYFRTVALGSGDIAWASPLTVTTGKVTMNADLEFTGEQEIQTDGGNLIIGAVGKVIIDIANINAAFTIQDGQGTPNTMFRIDSRLITDNSLVRITPPKVGFGDTYAAESGSSRAAIDIDSSDLYMTGNNSGNPITHIHGGIKMGQLTVTDATAVTATVASTVYIQGAPIAAGSVTITDSYALYVDAGKTRLDGLLELNSIAAGVTAAAGSSQGDGAITTLITQISACGTAGDAVTLPAAKAGAVIIVMNDGVESADVFPATGDDINELGANVQYPLPANKNAMFIAHDTTHWSVILTA